MESHFPCSSVDTVPLCGRVNFREVTDGQDEESYFYFSVFFLGSDHGS